jgi:hypothetical protein
MPVDLFPARFGSAVGSRREQGLPPRRPRVDASACGLSYLRCELAIPPSGPGSSGKVISSPRKFDVQLPPGILLMIITALGCFRAHPCSGIPGSTRGMILGMAARMVGYGIFPFRVFLELERETNPSRMAFDASTIE